MVIGTMAFSPQANRCAATKTGQRDVVGLFVLRHLWKVLRLLSRLVA